MATIRTGNGSGSKSGEAPHRVLILGGGFGGLYAAKALARSPVEVTLVDKRNFHLFQPLLYQVATGGLSPGDIASPLRGIVKKAKNIRVLLADALDLKPDERTVVLDCGEIPYDTLIVATGVSHHYFGHPEWEQSAPGLKTIEDALEIRRRVLNAFECAEREPDDDKRRDWLNFLIVGGGPTGVELAGALAELAHSTLRHNFRRFDPSDAKILLIEGTDRVLPTYPSHLSRKARRYLERLGVTVRTATMVTEIAEKTVTVESDGARETIRAATLLWAAGVRASDWGGILSRTAGTQLDDASRVIVEPDLSVRGHAEILVIGDLAHFAHQGPTALPGVAQVAMQQGAYAANLIRSRLRGRTLARFAYRAKGNLAVIGRNAAVADFGRLRFSGFIAWFVWAFVHVCFLIGFSNKVLVLVQWAWNYFTRNRGARLIGRKGTYEG
ncbi:MAG: NAD(P)/FAD-dependent oxidoreductase [Armatimonadetes bacterium]|nr:NAD(P)/FAD-dependent oxidoreductase [Armatimonadota bacterium]